MKHTYHPGPITRTHPRADYLAQCARALQARAHLINGATALHTEVTTANTDAFTLTNTLTLNDRDTVTALYIVRVTAPGLNRTPITVAENMLSDLRWHAAQARNRATAQ